MAASPGSGGMAATAGAAAADSGGDDVVDCGQGGVMGKASNAGVARLVLRAQGVAATTMDP
jgi:hypothetical protein